jgi:hypothetical protein
MKGDAVGRFKMRSSSGENGICGTMSVRNGINNKMMTGNPTAAVETSIRTVRGVLVSYRRTDGLRYRKGRRRMRRAHREKSTLVISDKAS